MSEAARGAVVSRAERVDVAIVGARLAGCALAAPLARAGRRVLLLDRMSFPSDQLSTHVLMPAGTSELAQIGALPRILALNPSRVRSVRVEVEGVVCLERLRPAADGTDFGVCVPRDLQDAELVAAVREQGAEVRERCTVTGLLWRAGRVSGVRYRDGDGGDHEVEALLVAGCDGRRSPVSALLGVARPYRVSRNGRGLVFRYLDDPLGDVAATTTYCQWRDGRSFAFAFPCTPAGRLLVLFMGHRDEASAARRDPEGYWAAKLREHPGLAERIAGATGGSKLRSTGETPAFFRASSGPGWALAGDAGHFKDPVTGQGMRDAMFAGRTLGEEIAECLDEPAGLDRATRRWEQSRDRECLPAYHFANADTRVQRQSPVLRELLRDAGRSTEPDIGDLFGRARNLPEIAPPSRLVRATLAALWRGERPRRETIASAMEDGRIAIRVEREARAGRFRAAGPVAGSDHPGGVWPPAGAASPGDPASGPDVGAEAILGVGAVPS